MRFLNKKIGWCFWALTLGCMPVFAQDARVLLEFEDAEQAFNKGDYTGALHHIHDVEKQAGVTSKTLYLRIVAAHELFDNGSRLYEDESRFKQLQRLWKNTQQYLNALSGQPIDDKYRKIYRISESLQTFPKNRSQWVRGKRAYQAQQKKEAEARQVQRQAEKALEQQRKAEQEMTAYANNLLPPESLRYNRLSRLLAHPTDSTCTVYFYRKPILSGRLVNTKIFLHDRFIFPLATKHYQKILLSAGVAKFNGLHGTFSETKKNRNSKVYKESTRCVRLKPGQIYYIDSRLQKFIVLKMVSKDEATSFIAAYEAMEGSIP